MVDLVMRGFGPPLSCGHFPRERGKPGLPWHPLLTGWAGLKPAPTWLGSPYAARKGECWMPYNAVELIGSNQQSRGRYEQGAGSNLGG